MNCILKIGVGKAKILDSQKSKGVQYLAITRHILLPQNLILLSSNITIYFSSIIYFKVDDFEEALRWYTFSLDCFVKNAQEYKDIAKLQVHI